MKAVILLMLLGVVISLGSALFSMTRKNGDPRRMLNALIWRVAMSAGLIIVLVVSWKLGYIEPGSVG